MTIEHSDIDPERLAALLERRLGDRERAELLARLADSEAGREILADAIGITRELASPTDSEAAARAAAPGRLHRLPWSRMAIAAGIVGIGVGVAIVVRRTTSLETDPGRVVALLGPGRAGLPDGWDGRPWATVRGDGAGLPPTVRAARLGARLVDLELAVRTRRGDMAPVADDIARLLEDVPGAGPVAAGYREIGRRGEAEPAALEPLLAQQRVAAAGLAGPARVALGAWTETARVAAANKVADFFDSRASQNLLDRSNSARELRPGEREALVRVRARLATGAPPDWPALERELTELLAALGS